MKNNIVLFFKGIMIGVSNVIPGVSGGTIALVLGIFDKLVESVNNFYKDLRKYLPFLIPIFLGAGVGILAFSSLIDYTLLNYSFPTCLFFVGLVVGSIPLIFKKAVHKGFRPSLLLPALLSFAVVILFSLLKSDNATVFSEEINFSKMVLFFFGGALASMAMVVPGISGSFVMVLLGIYPVVIKAVSDVKLILKNPTDMDLLLRIGSTIIPIGLGLLVGILLISRIIEFLLSKYYSVTYFVILGLIFGSIYGIFADPITYQSGVNTASMIVGLVTFVLGVLLSLFLGND